MTSGATRSEHLVPTGLKTSQYEGRNLSNGKAMKSWFLGSERKPLAQLHSLAACVVLLSLACSYDGPAKPSNCPPNCPTTPLATATVGGDPFRAGESCDGPTPPPTPTTFRALESSTQRTLEVMMSRTGLMEGMSYTGVYATLEEPNDVFRTDDGVVDLDDYTDFGIAGCFVGQLISDSGESLLVDVRFTADPSDRSLIATGTVGVDNFTSDSGEDLFPRQKASACIEDASFRDGTGAWINLTVESLIGDFLGGHTFGAPGPQTDVSLSVGDCRYTATSGQLSVGEVVRVFFGQGSYRDFITLATFSFETTSLPLPPICVERPSVTNGDLNLAAMYSAIDGSYTGITDYDIEVGTCVDPSDGGQLELSATMNLVSGDSKSFVADVTNNGTIDGFAITLTMTLTGTVNDDGSLSGTFTESGLGATGGGTFTGQLFRDAIIIEFTGQDTSGDTCHYTGSIMVARI